MALPFNKATEARSFSFFIHNTGPLLSQLSPQPKQFLEAVINSAWHSNASRSLLVALSMIDECRWTDAPRSQQGDIGAISHANATRIYNAAVGLMAREEYSISDVLIASLLAAIFELAYGQIRYVGLHLDSAIKIIQRGTDHPGSNQPRLAAEDSFLKTIFIPTLKGCQDFHESTRIFAVEKLVPSPSDSQASVASSTLPWRFSSVAEAACSMEKCLDLLHDGHLSPAEAVLFGHDWLESVRRYRGEASDLPVQRYSLYLVYATMGSSIETIWGELTEAEARVRWTYICSQIEKISEPPGFAGLSEVVTLITKAMGWYCKCSQLVNRTRQVLERAQNC